MRDDRASALRHDRGMRHAGFIAHGLQVIDDVAGVLLEGVVQARLEVGLRAVVVDAKASAHIHVLQSGAGLVQFDVDPRRLSECALDDADVRNLAAQMKVQQLEAVFHAALLQLFETLQDLSDRETELRSVTAGRLPPA